MVERIAAPPDGVAARRRQRWGRNLRRHMELTGYTVKQLQHELAVEGVHVSQQAISQWITGATAPRPENQVAIARIIAADPTALFPLDAA